MMLLLPTKLLLYPLGIAWVPASQEYPIIMLCQ